VFEELVEGVTNKPDVVMNCSDYIFSSHALTSMINRNIEADDVITTIEDGEIVADYPNDKPYASKLLLNFINGKALHVVVAQDTLSKRCIVITCYFPNPDLWDEGFKTKLK
jgi:hypothetical protein